MSRSLEPNPLAVTSSDPMKFRTISGDASTLKMKKSQPEVVSGLRSAPKQASVPDPRDVAVEPTVPVQATLPLPSEPRVSVAWLGEAAVADDAPRAASTIMATAVAALRANPLPGILLTSFGKLTTRGAGLAGTQSLVSARTSSSNAG